MNLRRSGACTGVLEADHIIVFQDGHCFFVLPKSDNWKFSSFGGCPQLWPPTHPWDDHTPTLKPHPQRDCNGR
jgi:hypothetical protein